MFQLFNKNFTYLKSKGVTAALCEHFQVVAAKKSQPLPHRVNGPLTDLIKIKLRSQGKKNSILRTRNVTYTPRHAV